jgi:phage-related baseplate assembly protein
MSRFSAINLAQLPPPQLIDPLDFERMLAELKDFVRLKLTEEGSTLLDTLNLESDPIVKILEVVAYRETLLRALVNDKAKAVLLAFAIGTDLDQIGALFGVARMVENGVPEIDERFRRRIALAPEAFSVAGPAGAYEFHALTLSLGISDAHAFTPSAEAGKVTLVLAGENGEDVSDANLSGVVTRLDRDNVVPLTDVVTVVRANRIMFDVSAVLTIPRGPDSNLLLNKAKQAIRDYAKAQYRIGAEVFTSGLIAAAKVGGVDDVVLSLPAVNVVCGDTEIAVLDQLTVTGNPV